MITELKQIIPSQFCLKCDICCRYLQESSVLVPCFLSEETEKGPIINDPKPLPIPYKDHYICQFFTPDKNGCSVYSSRPFDCRLYPFMVTYDKDFKSAVLALDTKCPYLTDKKYSKEFKEYTDYLIDILEGDDMVEKLNKNKNFINSFQDDSVVLKRLRNLTKRLCLLDYGFTRISLKDKGLFDGYFKKTDTQLASFSFEAIYVWSGILNILWKKINGALCIFAGNDNDYFLLLPPIHDKFNETAVRESVKILSDMNKDTTVSPRIENCPQGLYDKMACLGFQLKPSGLEYIYQREELSVLKGNKFKSKRASVNYFIKNYKYKARDLKKDDIFNCLKLYKKWAGQKLNRAKDRYFKLLIEDSYFAQKSAFMNLRSLNLKGIVVEIDKDIKAYTLGYPLNKEVFVILFETTDLNIKGISQFIFKEFCSQLSNYKYINTLGDSGLRNLKKVKESYRPVKRIPYHLATAR